MSRAYRGGNVNSYHVAVPSRCAPKFLTKPN